MVDRQNTAAVVDSAVRREGFEVFPGVVEQPRRPPTPRPQQPSRFQGASVVVTPDAGDAAIPHQGDRGIGLVAISHEVAGADDRGHPHRVETAQRGFQRADVGVDITDQAKPHGTGTYRLLGFREWNRGRASRPARQDIITNYRAWVLRLMSDMAAIMEASGGQIPEDVARFHLSSFPRSYRERFTPAEIAGHLRALATIGEAHPLRVRATPGDEPGTWSVLVLGFDTFQLLATVCHLITIHGGSIVNAHIFTSEPPPDPPRPLKKPPTPPSRARIARSADRRRRVVDEFLIREFDPERGPPDWSRFEAELSGLSILLRAGRYDEVNHHLIGRFVAVLERQERPEAAALPAMELTIDPDAAEQATRLHIRARDSLGFLSLVSSALSLCGVRIVEAEIRTTCGVADDVLLVTDRSGRKIASESAVRELRSSLILIAHFSQRLPHATDPASALLHFSRFAAETLSRARWANDLEALDRPVVLDALARVLGESDFFWEDFLHAQPENVLPVIATPALWQAPQKPEEVASHLAAILAEAGSRSDAQRALRKFKDREIFRIGIRAILGLCGGPDPFARELAEVAEALLREALAMAISEATLPASIPVALLALGKFGGRELGFGSDLELMLVYDDEAAGPDGEKAEGVVRALRQAIGGRPGGTFELDFRLRPYGNSGPPATSLSSFQAYYAPGGAAWSYERQALLKLRAIAGDATLGRQVEALRDRYVYSELPYDLVALREMRRLQIKQIVKPGRINAKFSSGSLVDIEYIVQAFQMSYGEHDPTLRSPNSMVALAALCDRGTIAPDLAATLRDGYRFFRGLIDALRVVHGHSRDLALPPYPSEEFALLARRLGYREPALLHEEVDRRRTATQHAVDRLSAELAGG